MIRCRGSSRHYIQRDLDKQTSATHKAEHLRAGNKSNQRVSTRLLASACDWQLKVDFGKKLRFLQLIARTSHRPELVSISDASKLVVLVELHWEDQLMETHEYKRPNILS